jgi:hypothetical protein
MQFRIDYNPTIEANRPTPLHKQVTAVDSPEGIVVLYRGDWKDPQFIVIPNEHISEDVMRIAKEQGINLECKYLAMHFNGCTMEMEIQVLDENPNTVN